MAKTTDRKRKRDSDAVDEEVSFPTKKVQLLGNGTPTATTERKEAQSGDQRQKKSERKKKRDLEAKANAVKKIFAQPSGGADDLAAGSDFVSLGGNGDGGEPVQVKSNSKAQRKSDKKAAKAAAKAAKAANYRPSFKAAAAKRASPRSIRKQEKATKIEGLMAEAAIAVDADAVDEGTSASKARFIVFVGNLPFSATESQIQAHFAKLRPKSIRHMTDKATGKSKGYAFLEFTDYDRMKTCLSQYHLSIFNPVDLPEGANPVEKDPITHKRARGRRLNVELTAGGGGNTAGRKTKIKTKNKKLYEERERARQNLKKKQQEKEGEKRVAAEKNGGVRLTGANAESSTGGATAGMGDVHPSRLGRVQG